MFFSSSSLITKVPCPNTTYLRIVVVPPFVGRHQVAVPPVRRRPVDGARLLDVLSVIRTLQEVQYPDLLRRPAGRRMDEVVLEEDRVRVGSPAPVVAEGAAVHRAAEEGARPRRLAPGAEAVVSEDHLLGRVVP